MSKELPIGACFVLTAKYSTLSKSVYLQIPQNYFFQFKISQISLDSAIKKCQTLDFEVVIKTANINTLFAISKSMSCPFTIRGTYCQKLDFKSDP